MKAWEVRQKHDEEVRGVYKKLGFMDAQGRVRKFDGKLFWPEMEKLRHTSNVLESCRCWASQPANVRRQGKIIGVTA